MPVRNGARFVREAIDSVLAQTFTDFELIVIDDASTDSTLDILQAITDPRVVVASNATNLGTARTQNRALALARGEYVAQHDADDVSDATRLARQVAFLDARPDIALVGSWYRKVDEDGVVLGERALPTEPAQIAWALVFYCPMVHSTVLYRRSVVLDAGGYDDTFRYASDYELWSRLATRYRLANLPAVLLAYRLTPGSLTATIGIASGEGERVALASATSLLELAGRRPPTSEAHRAMSAMVSGAPVAEPQEAMEAAFQGILELLEMFSRQPSVSTAEALDLRTEVRATLRRRLLERMAELDDERFARLRTLVAGDDRWLAMCSTAPTRRAFASFRRSALGAALARWTARGR